MNKDYLDMNSMEYLRYLFTKKIMDFSIEESIAVSLNRALNKSLMINLQQKEGSGKTTGMASYIIGSENCFYMKIGPSYSTRHFLEEMYFLISGKPVKTYSDNWELVRRIAKTLKAIKGKKLVCIDDCTFLTFRQLSHFHELRDLTIMHTALVFIAPPEFQARLEKATRKGTAGAGEFYRRFHGFIPLPGLTRVDIQKYCEVRKLEVSEIQAVLERQVQTISQLEIIVDKIMELRGDEDEMLAA